MSEGHEIGIVKHVLLLASHADRLKIFLVFHASTMEVVQMK